MNFNRESAYLTKAWVATQTPSLWEEECKAAKVANGIELTQGKHTVPLTSTSTPISTMTQTSINTDTLADADTAVFAILTPAIRTFILRPN